MQKVLSEKEWLNKMLPEDFRGLTPLFYGHIMPYGEFQLDMNKGINIEETNLKHQMAPECSSADTFVAGLTFIVNKIPDSDTFKYIL